MRAAARVRWAEESDGEWMSALDPSLDPAGLAYKLSRREIAVALLGEDRVGYLRVEWLWEHVPFVGWIVIDDTHRSKGVGALMMTWLRREMAERCPSEPYLWSSTEPANTGSQRWHLGLGFEESGFLAGVNPGGTGEIFYRVPLHRDPPGGGHTGA